MGFVPRADATKIIEEQDPGDLAWIVWRTAVRLHNRTNTLRVPRVPAHPATRSSHHPSAIPTLNGSLPFARDLAALVGPDLKQAPRSRLEKGKAVQGFVRNRVRRRRQEGVLGARLLVLDTDQHRA